MIEIKTTKDIVKEFVEFNEGGLGFVCCSRAWDKWVSLESLKKWIEDVQLKNPVCERVNCDGDCFHEGAGQVLLVLDSELNSGVGVKK